MSDVIWLNKPSILIKEKYILELIPKSYMSKFRKINAITRLLIVITILLFLLTGKISFIFSGIISLGLIYIISATKKEGLTPLKKKKVQFDIKATNPLNNVMFGDDPNRAGADKACEKNVVENINNSVKQMIQENNSSIDNINDKLFKDLGENLEFDRSMRQFYSTASTTIPNDQKSFADFCYGNMTSGKEGDKSALTRNSIHLHSSHL
jgi:hypothetical protein